MTWFIIRLHLFVHPISINIDIINTSLESTGDFISIFMNWSLNYFYVVSCNVYLHFLSIWFFHYFIKILFTYCKCLYFIQCFVEKFRTFVIHTRVVINRYWTFLFFTNCYILTKKNFVENLKSDTNIALGDKNNFKYFLILILNKVSISFKESWF